MISLHLAQQADAVLAATGYNPWDGVSPDFGVFTPIIKSKAGMFLGAFWAGGFLYASFKLIEAITLMARSKRQGYSDALEEAKSGVGWTAVTIVALAAVPAIYAALAG